MARKARSLEEASPLQPFLNKIILARKEKNKSICESGCLDAKRGLPALPDKSVDHVITDPPYEAYVHADGNRVARRPKVKARGVVKVDMGFEPMTDTQRALVTRQLVRVCRGWILIFCSDGDIGKWQDQLARFGAKRRTTCVWVKTTATPKFAGNGPAQGFEPIVVSWAGRGRSVWNGGGRYGVYSYPVSLKNRRHPAEKPLALIEQLLLDFTMPGQVVIDPYIGGGTLGIACKRLGRRFIGWEIDMKHAKTARAEIVRAKEQLRMSVFHQRVRGRSYGRTSGAQRAKQLTLI